MQPNTAIPPLSDTFVQQVKDAGFTHVVSVPDGYLAPLIHRLKAGCDLPHIHAAREEEAIGIASGIVLAGGTPLVMMQNVGWLNSIGCFATLCLNYRTPFVLLLAHRGNIYDANTYDIPKIRYMDGIMAQLNLRTVSYHQFRNEPNLLALTLRLAKTAGEPALLLLDMPPDHGVTKAAC